jgi:hypothetical protein
MSIRNWCSKAVALATLAASACAPATEDVDEEHVERTSQELYSAAGVTLWTSRVVPMCWHTDDFPNSTARTEARNAIQQAIESSWAKVSDLTVTWEECPTTGTAQHVRVKIETTDPTFNGNTIALGMATLTTPAQRVPPADPPGLLINLVSNWSSSQSLRDGLNALVRHEFGHILGFAHEMERSDFVGNSQCSKDAHPGGNTFLTGSDIDSIMTWSYCHSKFNLSAGDIIGVRNAYGYRSDVVLSDTAGTLYARKGSTGIYKKVGSTWTNIGGNAGEFVTVGTSLYGLTPDGLGVFKYSGSGTTWTNVGGAAARILRCASSLCAISADATMGLWRYSGSGTTWTQIGTSKAIQYASTASDIYRLRDDMSGVEIYSGSGTTWNSVGSLAASAIYATSTNVFATSLDGQTLSRYSGGSWATVGGTGATYVAVGSTLYGLLPDLGSVWAYSGSGTTWTAIGGAAHFIYGGNNLYALNPAKTEIWRYTGGTSWVSEGMP